MEIFTFFILGLGASALIASMALSLVLTFQASGVVNFAAGATAAFVAYVYWDLATRGRLFLGFEVQITPDGTGVNQWLALAIALLVAAALGYLQFYLVYRPLRNSGALAKVVASSGVLLVLQSLLVLSFGADSKTFKSIIPVAVISFDKINLPVDRLVIIVLTLLAAGILSFTYQKTSFGIRTRATADNLKGALLLGIKPGRYESLNWIIASVVTGLVGVLVSPLIGLQPAAMSLFIVPALCAVLIAGFTSFWIAAVAGIAIGALQSFVTFFQGFDWFPKVANAPLPGIKEALPFVIIGAVLFFRGRALPDRLTGDAPRLPRAPRPTRLLLRFGIATALALVVILLAPYGWRQALITSLIGAIVCMSLVVVTGFLGQVTLAQMAIAGISGFIVSKMSLQAGIEFPLGPLLAILFATLTGIIVALPALRMRGMQLAIITLAAAVAIQNVIFRNPDWGGGNKAAEIRPAKFFGIKLGSTDSFWNVDTTPSPGFALFILVITLLVALLVVSIRQSSLGARMLAVRADEAASASAGVNVVKTKIVAFALAGLIAGVAGALYGYNFGLVTAARFDEFSAIAFLAIAYLGGITTVTGAVIGGMLVPQGMVMFSIITIFGIDSSFQTLLAGIAVLVTVIGNPDGIAGFFRNKFADRKRKVLREHGSNTGAEMNQIDRDI